jgi:hypothetical protein
VEQVEVDKLIAELEIAVDRLRSLYEQYFMGYEKIEPTVPRKEVDRKIHALRKEQIRNTALRFRFQMILQRYNTYQTHWQRICREIENGTYSRHISRAQRRFASERPGAPRRSRPPPSTPPESIPPISLPISVDLGRDLAAELAELDKEFAPAGDPGFKPLAPLASLARPRGADANAPPGGPAAAVQAPAGRPGFPPPSEPFAPATPAKAFPAANAVQPPARPAPAPQALPARPAPAPSGPAAAGRPPPAPPPAPSRPTLEGGPFAPATPTRPFKPAMVASGLSTPTPPQAFVPVPPPPPEPSRPRLPSVTNEGGPRPAPTQERAAPFAARAGGPHLVARPAAASPATSSTTAAPSPGAPSAAGAAGAPARPAPGPGAVAPAPAPARAAPPVTSPAAAAAPANAPAPAPAGPAGPRIAARAPAARPVAPSPAAAAKAADELSEERMRSLYAQYTEARKKQNEAAVSYDAVSRSMRESSARLREKHGKSVDFEVAIKDGKTYLRPVLK